MLSPSPDRSAVTPGIARSTSMMLVAWRSAISSWSMIVVLDTARLSASKRSEMVEPVTVTVSSAIGAACR